MRLFLVFLFAFLFTGEGVLGDAGSDSNGGLGVTMEVPGMKEPPERPLHHLGDIPSPPHRPAPSGGDASLDEAYRGMLEDYYRTRQLEYRHRVEVFHWQLASGKFIFWTVIGMVLAGLCFSALQFQETLFPSAYLSRQLKFLRSLEASSRGGDSPARAAASPAGLKKEFGGDGTQKQETAIPPAFISPHPPSSIRESLPCHAF